MKTKTTRFALVVCLIASVQQALSAADLIIGSDSTSGANKLFSFLTDGSSGNGTLNANYLNIGGGAQGVTYDSLTQRIFATRGTATIAAFNEVNGTPVSGNPFTIPTPLTTASLRNLRMKADNTGILSAQFNSSTGRVQTLNPSSPGTASTVYSPITNVHSMFQPSIGGFVYAMDNNGTVTRFDDNGSNPVPISFTGLVTSNGNYRDIYFTNPTTFFMSVRATASTGAGGVYKFTLANSSASAATLDTSWGSSGKALVSNAVGLAASADGNWLYATANFSGPLSSIHSIRLTDASTNTLSSNIPATYNYITIAPEPSSIVLACFGGLALLVLRRTKKPLK